MVTEKVKEWECSLQFGSWKAGLQEQECCVFKKCCKAYKKKGKYCKKCPKKE